MIEASSLRKSFGTLSAVDGVSFSLGPGEILGLLGPNGAGKTTTVSMLVGLTEPDSGEVLVGGTALGGDADPAKGRIGLVPQEVALVEELSAWDNLRFFGALYDMRGKALREAMAHALEFVGLTDRAGDRVTSFSGGMKRRLNLAASLLHDPPVLLLDEPTVGVDPQSRNAIFDSLVALKEQGKALLYTTHYMEEAERLCDRILIMDHGKIIAQGTLRELAALLPATAKLKVELAAPVPPALLEELAGVESVERAEAGNGGLTLTLRDLAEGAPAVLAWLGARGVAYTHVESARAGLEEIFLSLTGKGLRDA
jgi:ABC-2 type transport system ATP-binding protein